MELIEDINVRRAKRALSDKKIPDDVIQRVMTAATYAPFCSNNQPWRFLVAKKADALRNVFEALPDANYWFKNAGRWSIAKGIANRSRRLSAIMSGA